MSRCVVLLVCLHPTEQLKRNQLSAYTASLYYPSHLLCRHTKQAHILLPDLFYTNPELKMSRTRCGLGAGRLW